MGGTWVKQYQDTEEGRWKSKKKGSASTLRAVPSNFTAVVAPIITFYYAIMAARQTVQYTHTNMHIHPLERHKKIFKNSNQQSYQQSEQRDETGCSGKAVGTVKGRKTRG